MTDVTIRGIDDEVYSKFAAEAKKTSKAIGELTTDAMRAYLEKVNGKSYKIENIEHLPVSKVDLESMDAPMRFTNIDLLEFEDDVDWDTFKNRVDRINNVDLIVIPKTLSKFQVLTKSSNVSMVVTKGSDLYQSMHLDKLKNLPKK